MTTINPVSRRPAKNGSFFVQQSEPIELEELRSSCPAIFQERAGPRVSDRYTFISTEVILRDLGDAGFKIHEARCSGCRSAEDREFGLHSVRLRQADSVLRIGQVVPEVILTASHNANKSVQLDVGLYRAVCKNGLVVASTAGTGFRIMHVGDKTQAVIQAAKEVIEYAPRLDAVIDKWQQRLLSATAIAAFTRRAVCLRYGSKESPGAAWDRARRDDDMGDDLWSVYNRVQENLMDGGIKYIGKGRRNYTVRPVGAVQRVLGINKGLWALAEEFSLN